MEKEQIKKELIRYHNWLRDNVSQPNRENIVIHVDRYFIYMDELKSDTCRKCGDNCKLNDCDAGTEREIKRLCKKCFQEKENYKL